MEFERVDRPTSSQLPLLHPISFIFRDSFPGSTALETRPKRKKITLIIYTSNIYKRLKKYSWDGSRGVTDLRIPVWILGLGLASPHISGIHIISNTHQVFLTMGVTCPSGSILSTNIYYIRECNMISMTHGRHATFSVIHNPRNIFIQ